MLIIMENDDYIYLLLLYDDALSPPFPKFCVTFSTTRSLNCHFSGKFSLENFKTFGHTCFLRYGFTRSKCTFCIFSPKIIQTIATVRKSKHCVNTIVNHGCASKYRSLRRILHRIFSLKFSPPRRNSSSSSSSSSCRRVLSSVSSSSR